MRSYLERVLRAAVASAALLVGGVLPAQAALYTGAWDPKFGAPFVNPPLSFDLSWAGSFTIDANCPATGGGNLSGCTPATASVVSASVVLSRPGGGTSTIAFSPSSITIADLFFNNDVIEQLKTDLSNWDDAPASSDTTLNNALAGWEFALQFVMSGVGTESNPPVGNPDPFPAIPVDYSGPVLFARYTTTLDCDKGDQRRASDESDKKDEGKGKKDKRKKEKTEEDCEPSSVTYFYQSDVARFEPEFTGLTRVSEQQLPEPSGLALLAGALLAAGLFGRSRRSQR